MAKMVISLVIEGNKEDLHTIKGNIIATACEALVSVTANEIEEPKKQIEIPAFMAYVAPRGCGRTYKGE